VEEETLLAVPQLWGIKAISSCTGLVLHPYYKQKDCNILSICITPPLLLLLHSSGGRKKKKKR